MVADNISTCGECLGANADMHIETVITIQQRRDVKENRMRNHANRKRGKRLCQPRNSISSINANRAGQNHSQKC